MLFTFFKFFCLYFESREHSSIVRRGLPGQAIIAGPVPLALWPTKPSISSRVGKLVAA